MTTPNWTVYTTFNSELPSNEVHSIAIDEIDNKWIGTREGLAKFDGTNWTVYNTSNSGLPGNYVIPIVIDGSGNKWVGTWDNGLAKFDGTNWTVYKTSNSDLPDNNVLSLAIDGSGNKWIGTDRRRDGKSPVAQNIISVPPQMHVKLCIYDILGQEIATLVNEYQKPGYYEITWNAGNLPSGVYIYRLQAGASTGSANGNYVESKKMILLK